MGKMIFISLHLGDSSNTEIVINVEKILAIKESETNHSVIYMDGDRTSFYVDESVQEVMDLIMNLKEYFN